MDINELGTKLNKENNSNNSLDNQVMYFRNLITENKNWTYVDGYIDEGITGTNAI